MSFFRKIKEFVLSLFGVINFEDNEVKNNIFLNENEDDIIT
jgi:hypothetical protein